MVSVANLSGVQGPFLVDGSAPPLLFFGDREVWMVSTFLGPMLNPSSTTGNDRPVERFSETDLENHRAEGWREEWKDIFKRRDRRS